MKAEVLSYVLALALLAHVGAHVAIVVGLLQSRAWGRAALALFVAPLAPWWGWSSGMKRRVWTWGGSLAVFALAVALS